jgi:hypothetical protein
VYDDLCGDAVINPHIVLNEVVTCPLSVGCPGFGFFSDLLLEHAEKIEIQRRGLVSGGLNTRLYFKGMPQPKQFKEANSASQRLERRSAAAKKAGLSAVSRETCEATTQAQVCRGLGG